MFGGRPTQLIDTVHRNRFLSTICSRVDLNYISRQTCSFIMWWPDFGIENHASKVTKIRLSKVWHLLSLKLYLLVWRLDSEHFNGHGFDHVRAQLIKEWVNGLPLSQQLNQLLVELSLLWMSTDASTLPEFTELSTEGTEGSTTPLAIPDPVFMGFPSMQDQASIEDETSTSTAPVVISDVGEASTRIASVVQSDIGEASTSASIVLQSDIGEATVTDLTNEDDVELATVLVNNDQDHLDDHFRGWARWTETQAMNRTMQRVPNFLALSSAEQITELTRTGQVWNATVRQTRLSNSIAAGDFVPRDGESNEEQLTRFQRQINMDRVRRNPSPASKTYTCVYCNQLIEKELTNRNKLQVPTRPENCPNGNKITIGWSFVLGEYGDIFPDANIFTLFAKSLHPGTVLNHAQLAREVAIFCYNNQWHPQVEHLMDTDYHTSWRRLIEQYVAGQNPGTVKSGWITAVKEVMAKLARTEPIHAVQRLKTIAEGYRLSYPESTNTMWVYAFRPASNDRDDILRLEQP